MAYSKLFTDCIEFIIINFEGTTLSLDPNDKGNWTGSNVGSGQLRGSKYGLSAASYPNLDFSKLTIEDSLPIYYSDFWLKINGDNLPPEMALPVLDFAINSGINTAIGQLQKYLKVPVDYIIGEKQTLPALSNMIRANKAVYVVAEYCSLRLTFLQQTKSWSKYHESWERRTLMVMFQTAAITAGNS